jgi:ABC-type cobalamin/Fe3+-siderophores transport system ATPase subunit
LHDLVFAARYCSRFLLLYGDGHHSVGAPDQIMTADVLSQLYGFPLTELNIAGERLFLPAREAEVPHV